MRLIDMKATEAYCDECGLTLEFFEVEGRLEIPGGFTTSCTREEFDQVVENHREECK